MLHPGRNNSQRPATASGQRKHEHADIHAQIPRDPQTCHTHNISNIPAEVRVEVGAQCG